MRPQNRDGAPGQLLGDLRQDVPGRLVGDAHADDAAMEVDRERVPGPHPTAGVLVVSPRLERLEFELRECRLCAPRSAGATRRSTSTE